MGRTFDGRDISKTILNIGVAGEIKLAEALPSLSIVCFQAKAKVGAVKHVFKDDGTVKEQVIISLDPKSFEILTIQKPTEQPELPLHQGTVTVAETDAAAEAMGLKGPLLVACEACGHGKGDHEANAANGDQDGRCLNPGCQCERYVPFAEAPTEEEMEPVGYDEGIAADTAAEAEAEEMPA